MDVCLTPALIEFIELEVAGGLYETADEVVRAGLRRLKEEKERQPDGETAFPAEWAQRPVRCIGSNAAEGRNEADRARVRQRVAARLVKRAA